jgi:hypothetical protein
VNLSITSLNISSSAAFYEDCDKSFPLKIFNS